MKTVEEFKEYFEGELSPEIDRLETPRIKVKRLTIFLIAVTVLLFIAVGLLFFRYGMTFAAVSMISWFVLVVVMGIIISKRISAIKVAYKDVIIKPMIAFVSKDLSYHPTAFVSQNEYTQSGIFITKPDRFKGDDLVEGKIESTEFKFSEIHSEYKTTDGDGKTQWNTIFQGIFFIADFHKNFNGRTYVLPDLAEKWFGSFGKMMQKANVSRPDLVKLEDPAFEKEFVVYGTDQVEARYILSPKMMERITELKKKTDGISLSFVDSKVHIAIRVRGSLFEPKIFSSMKNFKHIEPYFTYLVLAINIVEDLDLNTRIWTKK